MTMKLLLATILVAAAPRASLASVLRTEHSVLCTLPPARRASLRSVRPTLFAL